MSGIGVKDLIRAYALFAKARGIHRLIDSAKTANSACEPGHGPFGEEWFTKRERDLDEIGKEMTRIERRGNENER